MTHDEKIVEAVARAIDTELEGPVANQDFARQLRQWELSQKLARAAITAYQAEAWQDISTAPKDGSTFLAYQDDDGVDFFHWQDFGPDSTAPKGWRDSFINVYSEEAPNRPKFWQPLPPAPKATP